MSYARGTVIAGKYRIERVIGEGGMGIVLAARHLGLDEMVAVKLIREERAEGADALARFQREARAAARIKSEHVARVLDVDRLPEGDPYIVMELIDGVDLQGLVKRRGALPPDEAVTYIMQACEGLAEAHALGMVHRDLKLKNLFLTKRRDGRALIKVIDFGVVKFSPIATDGDADEDDETTLGSGAHRNLSSRSARESTLTGTAVLVGSVHYMAPEQIRASNVVDPRADVWSLGVCLYAMLTTELPFDGESVANVVYAIQGRPTPDVRTRAPHISPELAGIISKALEKDVRRRYSNVAELASALAPFSLDLAAAARIETILQSGIRAPHEQTMTAVSSGSGSHNSNNNSSNNSASGVDVMGPTQTSDASPMGIAKGRVESTIDAAAVGSLASHPVPTASTTKRSRMLTGALVAFTAAAATLLIWGRARPQQQRPAADDGPPAVMTTLTQPGQTTAGTPNIPATSTPTVPVPIIIAPPPVATMTATTGGAATPVSPPRPTTTTTAKRPPRPGKGATTEAAKPAPPKGEPSSAYDHF